MIIPHFIIYIALFFVEYICILSGKVRDLGFTDGISWLRIPCHFGSWTMRCLNQGCVIGWNHSDVQQAVWLSANIQ